MSYKTLLKTKGITPDKVEKYHLQRKAKKQRERALDIYKKTHGGLSPDQFKRKKEKSFMNSLRRG